jgi:hypothetical protein
VVLVYLILPIQALWPVKDPDIWWHLRTGDWIVANLGVPYQDYFSTYGKGKPWIAYSWLFEVCVYAVYARFGLTGLVYFTVVLAVSITFAVHQLVRLTRVPLVMEVALSGFALAAMSPLMTPRPWLFTILFFSIELILISRAREEGKHQALWFLPLVFMFWANLHIQFIYGLAVLGLLLVESTLAAGLGGDKVASAAPRLSPKVVILVAAASVLATLVSPYHVLIFRPIWEYIGQTGAFQNISELHPMFFRSPGDWIVLSLTLVAVFALGWQRKWSLFPSLLLILGVFLGFRAKRDAWFIVLAAIGIIGNHFRIHWPGNSYTFTKGQIAAVAVLAASTLFFLGIHRQINEPNLQSIVAKEFPVDAVAYVTRNRLRGSIFNTLDWGGFLIWSLPELPVTIDGRTNLHGDERLQALFDVWLGRPGWDSNPEFRSASIIIADHSRPLSWLLRSDSRYTIAYEDRTALVFTPAADSPGK